MEEQNYDPILVRYGGAKKFISEMDNEELQQAAESILRRAKEQAFSKGLPIYFSKGGVVLAEFPDGRTETAQVRNGTAVVSKTDNSMARIDLRG
jgi:hypothetical protein